MTYENLADRVIFLAKNNGADKVDIIIADDTRSEVSVRYSKIETLESSRSSAVGIRVLVGKRQAVVSSSDFSENVIDDLAKKAVDIAKNNIDDPFIDFASNDMLLKDAKRDLELYDKKELSINELTALAQEAEDSALAHKEVTNIESSVASFSKSNLFLASSEGFVNKYKSSGFYIATSVIAGKDNDMQTDYDFSYKRFYEDLKSPISIGNKAASRAIHSLNSKKIKSKEMSVIFEPRVASKLLLGFSSAINGDNIARGISFLKNHLGKNVFPKSINILDDPFIKRGLGSRPFDVEGIEGYKKYIIENGMLKIWITDIRSANQLGSNTTGNASRGISSLPSASITNLYLEAGNVTADELIKSVKNGVYITQLLGHGSNIVTGDYSQGASGFLIENGEITHPISNFTIASNLLDMFTRLTCANDLSFEYAISSPTILIEKMTIAGV